MTAPTTISGHVFIGIIFCSFWLEKTARGFQRRWFESSKKLDETHFLQPNLYSSSRVPRRVAIEPELNVEPEESSCWT
jgi:hypothetical protein